MSVESQLPNTNPKNAKAIMTFISNFYFKDQTFQIPFPSKPQKTVSSSQNIQISINFINFIMLINYIPLYIYPIPLHPVPHPHTPTIILQNTTIFVHEPYYKPTNIPVLEYEKRNKSTSTHVQHPDKNPKIQGLINRVQNMDQLLTSQIINKFSPDRNNSIMSITPKSNTRTNLMLSNNQSRNDYLNQEGTPLRKQDRDRIHSSIASKFQVDTQEKKHFHTETDDTTTIIQRKIGHLRTQTSQRTLYEDNTYYVGELNEHGQKEGIGILYDQDRSKIYSGIWKNNVYDTQGKVYFNKDQCTKININSFDDYRKVKQNKVSYTGEFRDGQITGLGQMLFSNVDNKRFIFYGRFQMGYFDGPGSVLEVFGGKNKLEAVWKHGVLMNKSFQLIN